MVIKRMWKYLFHEANWETNRETLGKQKKRVKKRLLDKKTDLDEQDILSSIFNEKI